jgi:RNA polymerase sigma-70 factor (ECF subfamily)
MDLERRIGDLREKGDLREAATCAVEGFGPEVFGFLVTLLRDEHEANDVFSQACEDMWKSIDRFEGRCSMRAWLYMLARHAATRSRRSPHRRPGTHVALSEAHEVAERVRSQTSAHLRTSVKDRFAAIRDSLDEDDRALLVLRLDRRMSWREIAHTFAAEGDSDEALRRLEVRLRKRLQHVKEEIRDRAREAGLLENGE